MLQERNVTISSNLLTEDNRETSGYNNNLMDAEKILEDLPRFNFLQLIVVCSIGFICIRGPWQLFGISFIADIPYNYTCVVPENYTGIYNATQCSLIEIATAAEVPCTEWRYYDLEPENSIITQWNLVCLDEYLPTLEQTLYVTGQMIGALFLAPLSDHFGRRPTVILGLLLHLVFAVPLMFSVSIYMFIPLRFAMGCVNQMVVTASYVLLAEWYSVKWRTVATNSIMAFWVLGIISMAGIAFLIRNWRGLILAYTIVPDCIVFLLFFILPESLFFLIANGRYREVEKILKRLKGWSQNATNSTMEMVSRASAIDLASQQKLQDEAKGTMRRAIRDLFKSRRMLLYAITLFWLSISLNLSYYVATMTTGLLSGDKYLNYVLSGVVELPFVVVTMILSVFVPRTILLVGLYAIAFIGFTISSLLPSFIAGAGQISTGFAFIGRGAISGGYIVQLLFTTEMFPTIVRNAGLGFYQVAENLGPVIGAPIMALPWDEYGPGSLYFVLGISALVNTLVISLMPETRGYLLPETVQEIEARKAGAFWRYVTCKWKKDQTRDETQSDPNKSEPLNLQEIAKSDFIDVAL